MMLRAFLVDQLGPTASETLLNVAAVVEWFRSTLPFGPDEALRQTAECRRMMGESSESAPLSEALRVKMRVLRQIKNNLLVIAFLVEGGHIAPDAELAQWCSIRKQLP
jgi:hypothetical protein